MEPYKELEQEFAKHGKMKHAISVNSGTSALHLALLAIGVEEGDEVIVPDFTFASCAFAVTYCNAKPVFVDCDETLNIDVSKIEAKITDKTKVIMAVHVYGRKCDIGEIKRIARKHRIKVLEDMSEAHGIIPSGDIAIYSFQNSKIIHSEEGGIILTNNDEWADEMRLRKTLANRGDYYHPVLGFNYRMANSLARLALQSFYALQDNLKLRKEQEQFLKVQYPCLRPPRDVAWVYDYLCTSETERDEMIKAIPGARPFFKPLSTLPMYQQEVGENALMFSKLGLVIPIKID